MAPVWLLAVLVFLCLGPGGDAIKCHHCMVNSPSEKCSETCTEKNGFCATATARETPRGETAIGKSCVPKNYVHCVQNRPNIQPSYTVTYTCCNKSDFCNS